jgi:hypothetical protein
MVFVGQQCLLSYSKRDAHTYQPGMISITLAHANKPSLPKQASSCWSEEDTFEPGSTTACSSPRTPPGSPRSSWPLSPPPAPRKPSPNQTAPLFTSEAAVSLLGECHKGFYQGSVRVFAWR